MFNSPYQTTPFQKFIFAKTAAVIRRLEIDEKLIKMTPDGSIMAIPPGVTEIPPFTMWMTKDQIPNMNAHIVIDGRGLLKQDGTPSKQDVYDFYLNTGILIDQWMGGDYDDLLTAGGAFLPKMYGIWIRNGSAGRIGLDFGQSYLLQAASVVFYLQLFGGYNNNSNSNAFDRILNRASRSLPSTDSFSLSKAFNDDIPALETVDDLLTWVRDLLDTPRSEGLTPALLRTSASRSWYPAYREITNAALEYPPVFASMIYHSIKSKGFVRTDLGTMLTKSANGKDVEVFVKSMERLLNR